MRSKENVRLDELAQETNIITEGEVRKIIKTFKQRAPGADKITKYHLDKLPANIILNLTQIFNASLAIGYFPKQWKTSIMIFIPKGNKSPMQHSNYRPISLLNVLGKVFEKIINKRLLDKIQELDLNNKRQHGFTKKQRNSHCNRNTI